MCSSFIKDEFWKVGGFPEKTIMNEDMIISSKLIFNNKKVFMLQKQKLYTHINILIFNNLNVILM